MDYLDLVAILAVLQYLMFGVLVGRARGRYGVKAPAITGHEMFERAYRVQMNTLELLVALLPGLYLCARHVSMPLAAGLGAVYLVGRVLYWRAYTSDPARRGLGFVLSIVPVIALLVIALMGAL